jgi:1,2-diacylglycerol 3-beta-galactosyltransferase
LKKILMLIMDAGGGHRASADAIIEGLAHLYGDEVAATVVDVSKEISFPLMRPVDDVYRWLTADGVWLWKALWRTGDRPWFPQVCSRMLTPLFSSTVERLIRSEEPDLVVGVHSLVNHIPLRVLRKKMRTDIPFATVITDMVTVHPTWVCPEVDYCMVPTEAARQQAVKFGMAPERVGVVGQPVSLKFATMHAEKHDLRQRLNMDQDRSAILIVGGGDGIGPMYEIARAIATRVPNAQMLVVAGRNRALKRKLEGTAWEIPTHVYGFVDNMPDLMGASDLLITKAGPGTLAEAFAAGLPVVISGYIPGQEKGNVDYVLENQAGAFATDPAEIAEIVREWLWSGSDAFQQEVANAAALARPAAVLDIAERLYGMLQTAEQAAVRTKPEVVSV